MSQIIKKFIGNDQVGAEKILLENNSSLRASNTADVAVDLMKLDAADNLLLQRSLYPEVTTLDLGSYDNSFQQMYLQKLSVINAGAEMGGMFYDAGMGLVIGSPTQDVFIFEGKVNSQLKIQTGDASGADDASWIVLQGGNADTANAGGIALNAGANTAGVLNSITMQACEVSMFAPQYGVSLTQDTKLSFSSVSHAFITSIQGSSAATASAAYVLPVADGADGQVLKTNGAGQLAWVDNMVSLANDQYLVAENAAGTGTVNIIKVDPSDHIVLGGDLYMAGYAIEQVISVSSDAGLTLDAAGGNAIIQSSQAIQLKSDTGFVRIEPNASAASSAIQFFDGTGAQSVNFKAPEALAGSTTYVLPLSDGTNGQNLVTDGAGNLSWASEPVQKVWARETVHIDVANHASLAQAPIKESLIVFVSGVMMRYGVDYEVDATTATQLNFNLPGGAPVIVAADDIYVQYQY